jgi:chitodextrinase
LQGGFNWWQVNFDSGVDGYVVEDYLAKYVAPTPTPTPTTDTVAPSMPSGLTGQAVSQTQINLNWVASTDNIAVIGYKVFRGGVQVGTTTITSYQSTGLVAGTGYSFRVQAFDAAGNLSQQSAAVTVSTLSAGVTPTPINGTCGTSNGATLSSAPTTNLCVTGTTSSISGTGPWTWTCAGSNGGTTANCSATKVVSVPQASSSGPVSPSPTPIPTPQPQPAPSPAGSQSPTPAPAPTPAPSVPSSGGAGTGTTIPPSTSPAPTPVPTPTPTGGVKWPGTFNRNLMVGMRGEDVKRLQQFLNSQGYLIASSGVGSLGNETTYFGLATARAVIRYQEAHKAELLSPVGLSRGTGYVGPLLRKKLGSIR